MNMVIKMLLVRVKYQFSKHISVSLGSYIDAQSELGVYTKLLNKAKVTNSSIGDFSYIAGGIVNNTVIGKFCCIGAGARVGGLGVHPTQMLSSHPAFYSTLLQCGISFVDKSFYQEFSETMIGNDVWIGANAIVLDGITIGNGAIVAAGAVVTKDVAAYSIVGGIPAKVIRQRYSQPEIELLEQLKWWDQGLDTLNTIAPIIRANSVSQLKDYLERETSVG